MRAKHLQDALDDEQAIERLRKELKKKQEELAIKRQEIFQAYEEARHKREIIEKLRERKLADYIRRQTKAEQGAIDDLFLARRKPTQ